MITPGTNVSCLLERSGGGVPLSKSSPSNSAFNTLKNHYSALVETGDLDNPGILLLIGEQSVRTVDGRGCFISGRARYKTISLKLLVLKTEVSFFKNI